MPGVAVLVIIAGAIGQGADAGPSREAQLEHVRVAYSANRASFRFGQFSFGLTTGTAKNVADAREGRLDSARRAAGLYVFDESNALYESVYPDDVLLAATHPVGGGKVRVDVSSYRMLTEGEVAIIDRLHVDPSGDKKVQHAVLTVPASRFGGRVVFPINLGPFPSPSFNLADDLDALARGEITLKEFDPSRSLDGRQVAFLSLRAKNGDRSYWIDLERGGIPLQIRDDLDAGYFVQVNFDGLEWQVNAAWLPMVMTKYYSESKIVARVTMENVLIDSPPPASRFRLDFPEEVYLVDQVRGKGYAPSKTLSLLNLPRTTSVRRTDQAVAGYQPPPPMPGETTTAWPWPRLLIGAAGLALVAIAAIRMMRSRTSR
jgi:hypothetical protein